jgi:hypothetical protein
MRLAWDSKKQGLYPLANVRIRGKIPREEWPKIAARFHNGETLTEIGRSYSCTAPAIRYIVARTSVRGATAEKMGRDKLEKIAVIASAEYRRNTRIGGGAPDSSMMDLWVRVNTDIATFLAGIDLLASDDSDANYEALLEATDRLLWASARTRLEVERLLGNRKKGASLRRMSG